MIPAAFDYAAPQTVADAVAALGSDAEEIKVMAGGQSLIPVLRLRLAAPTLIVDIGRITELEGIADSGDAIVIGAMTTHADVADSDLIKEHAGLLAKAAQTVADPQVRHRGTLGGALVHADPAGDLPAPILALDAELVVTGADGERTIKAADFFTDLFTTSIGEREILTKIRIPKHTGWKSHYEKFTRVAQQWSIVGVAVTVKLDGDAISEAKVALTNMGSTPIRAHAVEQGLVGASASDDAVRQAAAAAADGTDPPTDTNGDADYRRHLATVLTGRAVVAAASS
ncbi:MAG: xanthine dehydrogenase family protein subunit M [Propionibacteriales bacterium]|nr:xanthine dehydrogenase family protein subunit M [Propionibacteriales bacterium]